MSSASPYESDRAVGSRQLVAVVDPRRICLPAGRCAGFWTAVLLPFVLLTLLVGGVAAEQPFVAGGLLAATLAGLVAGRTHKR
jgi:hypothetical protein